MIRRNLRRFAARVDAARFRAKPDHRAFIRLAYELAFKREPDEDGYRRHQADLERGLRPADLLAGLVEDRLNAPPQSGTPHEGGPSARVLPEQADHLIHLAFRNLLRRDADAETYEAYREAFERGTTFLDLVNDITESEEFKIIDERIEHLFAISDPPQSSVAERQVGSDMEAALTLLETSLSDKGCKLQLGAVPAGTIDRATAHQRMRSLLITLSLLDKL